MTVSSGKTVTAGPVTFVGIDWADRLHAFHLLGDHTETCGEFSQDAADIKAAIRRWRKLAPDAVLAVAIEQSRGPLISALLMDEDLVIYPVNPAALAAYRKAFAHGGGKNDPGDARLLAQYLQHYHEQLRPLRRDEPNTREITAYSEDRRNLVNDRAALANELRSILKLYFPAVLAMRPAQMYADFVLRLLQAYPTLEAAQQADHDSLYQCLRGGTPKKIESRIATLLTAVPLTTDPVLIRTCARRVTSLCQRLSVLNDLIDGYNTEIDRLVREHADYEIVSSLPASSTTTQARMIAALGDDRSRYRSASELQAAAGIAPLRIQSGRQNITTARWACSKFLKQTFHEYAGLSIRRSAWAKAYYQLQRRRGKTGQMAIRALAFKWMRIIYRCWQERVPYNEARYIERLKATGSPICELIKKPDNLTENT